MNVVESDFPLKSIPLVSGKELIPLHIPRLAAALNNGLVCSTLRDVARKMSFLQPTAADACDAARRFLTHTTPLLGCAGTFFRSTGHGHAHAVVLGGGAPVPVSAPRRNPHMSVEERRTYAQLHDIVE